MPVYDGEIVVPCDCKSPAAGTRVTVVVEKSEYVLAVARDAGVWLPADCQHDAMPDHPAGHGLPPGRTKR